jgi:2-keto-4-pentenoate hydratase/2-oxohepta-3-ene-1,7-dioic acid hydratase in catechol pathway
LKIVTFDDNRVGIVDGTNVHDVTEGLPQWLENVPEQRVNWLVRNWGTHQDNIHALARDSEPTPIAGVTLRAANPAPSHVFALPANFRAHIGELKERVVTKAGRSAREQGFFLKAPGSLVGAGQAIVLPRGSSRRFDHECELAVVIGSTARNVAREQALDYVFGYSCLVDITMRIEPGSLEEERSMRKSFSTFTPLGPSIVTRDEVPDLDQVTSELWVNGERRQLARMDELIVGVAEAVELVSSVVTINPGDVIAMGTPSGVAAIRPGDGLRIRIDNIGEMTLPVLEADTDSPRPY